MFDTVALTASARKLRLFATACCRRLAPQFKDERSLNMVDASEQFADGDLTEAELRAAFEEAAEAVEAIHWEGGDAVDQASAEAVLGLHSVLDITQVFEGIGEVVGSLATAEVWDRIYAPGRHWSESQGEEAEVSDAGRQKEAGVLATILRDVFGNPFRPVAFDPAWRTDTALALARQMYDSRECSAMPILADALQDAGCDSDDILNHCREPGTHVRGCWVVDLVLGKV
jgi:hypothetical protein